MTTSATEQIEARISRIARLVFFAMVASVVGLWFITTLSWPFGRDQGILAWAADSIHRGGMPYKDAWEVKGPMAILPFAAAEFIFGRNMWGLRLIDAALSIANLATIFVIARTWLGRHTGVYALALAAMFTVTLDFWETAQPDGWCGYFLTFVVALLAIGARPIRAARFFAAGFILGICVLVKPVYVIYALLFFAPLRWKRRDGELWPGVIASASGLILPVLIVGSWFAAQGSLGAMVQTYLLFNLRTHSALNAFSPRQQIQVFADAMRSMTPFATCLFPAFIGGFFLLRSDRRADLTYFIWLVLGLVFVVIQRKYFPYHWLPAFWPVAIGTAIALGAARDWLLPFPSSWRVRLSVADVALVWAAFLYLSLALPFIGKYAAFQSGRMSREAYEAGFEFNGRNYYWFPRIREIADYVHSRTHSGQSVLVWGFDPGINYLSDRPSPSRFGYAYPLELGLQNPYTSIYRLEFMQSVRANPPAYIVVADHDSNLLVSKTSEQAFDEFNDLHQFVSESYAPDVTIEGWKLWKRKH